MYCSHSSRHSRLFLFQRDDRCSVACGGTYNIYGFTFSFSRDTHRCTHVHKGLYSCILDTSLSVSASSERRRVESELTARNARASDRRFDSTAFGRRASKGNAIVMCCLKDIEGCRNKKQGNTSRSGFRKTKPR